MKKARALTVLRWLVVLTTGFAVLSAPVLASAPSVPREKCDASCAARCPCCVSKPAPASPQPLVPPAPRLTLEKSFQIAPLLIALLVPTHEFNVAAVFSHSPVSLRSEAPLYERHCAYLI